MPCFRNPEYNQPEMPEIKKVKKSEWLIAIAVSLAILLVLNLPNYLGQVFPKEDKVFTGYISVQDPWDINVYAAAINWSQENGLYFQNAYTTKEHKSVALYPFYTIVGNLFPNSDVFSLLRVSALATGAILLLTIYRLAKIFLPKQKDALLALFLTVFGGGFGWLLFKVISSPDLNTTPFAFTNTLLRPHETLAVAFYLAAFSFLYLGTEKNKIKYTVLSALFMNGVSIFYPLYLASYYLIGIIFSTLRYSRKNIRHTVKHIGAVVLLTFPTGAAYSLYLLSSETFERVLSPDIQTPGIPLLAAGYGLVGFVAIWWLFFKKGKKESEVFLALWFFINIGLSYLPIGFARQYLRGLFFPAVILLILNMDSVSKWLKVKKNIVLVFIAVLVPVTGLLLTAIRYLSVFHGESNWHYISTQENAALQYLDGETPDGSGVLSGYTIGNMIPAKTHNRVYFGHYHQTPDYWEKINNLTNFYSNNFSENEAEDFLKANNISHIYWGSDEKNITFSSDNDELEYRFLETVFSNTQVTIFSYKP